MSVETLAEQDPVATESPPPPVPAATPLDEVEVVVTSLPERDQGQSTPSMPAGIAALLAMAAVLTRREAGQI